MTGSTVFWYASRATGIVALLLLTAVLVLGLVVTGQGRIPGLPRFAVTSLHRNLSLLAVAFIAVHVLTAALDTYVSIPLVSALVPFTSGYERFWLGLGAVCLDLKHGRLLALAVGCALVVGAAVAWRLAAAARQVPRAGRVAAVFAEHTSQPSARARAGRRPASR
jgi:hypothetical protein